MGNMKKCMKKKKTSNNTIILVPYPAQGHVTPMFKLASAFLTLGFNPILVTPDYIHRHINDDSGVKCIPISDGSDEDTPRDFFSIENAMENNMPAHLERLIRQLQENNGNVLCVVIDLLASWAIRVAEKCGVETAGFWPAMFATYRLIGAIPEMLRNGLIGDAG